MHTYGDPIPGTREEKIQKIERLPDDVQQVVARLTDRQLDTPYRAGGWTVRQVVHHLADSHMNAYTRVRLLLTEDEPTIKPYDQDKWASLPDARTLGSPFDPRNVTREFRTMLGTVNLPAIRFHDLRHRCNVAADARRRHADEHGTLGLAAREFPLETLITVGQDGVPIRR